MFSILWKRMLWLAMLLQVSNAEKTHPVFYLEQEHEFSSLSHLCGSTHRMEKIPIPFPVSSSVSNTADPNKTLHGQAEVEARKSSACCSIHIPHGPAVQANELEQLGPFHSPHCSLIIPIIPDFKCIFGFALHFWTKISNEWGVECTVLPLLLTGRSVQLLGLKKQFSFMELHPRFEKL